VGLASAFSPHCTASLLFQKQTKCNARNTAAAGLNVSIIYFVAKCYRHFTPKMYVKSILENYLNAKCHVFWKNIYLEHVLKYL